MPELLLEVGCEELPASAVRRAYEDLRDSLAQLLSEAGVLESEAAMAMGTPRRLIVSFADLLERQPDATKEVRGPNVQGAYKDGQPSPALLGFCRGQGVDVSDVREEGGYIWATKKIVGRQTGELLAELIPQAIRGLQFEKSMRWGQSKMRFARPIRWVLASFGGQGVAFEIEGVHAGFRSAGHRFYSPECFEARTLEELVSLLRQRFVEPDPDVRRERILQGAQRLAGGLAEMSEELIDENVFLTEWPEAIEGRFPEEYLELPPPVLVTAMAKHEKSFPVRDRDGQLTNRFIAIRNSGQDDDVRKGYEWVLNARFNDAKFFYEEDQKHSLAEFLERAKGILFQEKLGTVRARADRLAGLCADLATLTGCPPETADLARIAGLYAKADLSTGLVGEFANLQGVIGGEYAGREGFAAEVCSAIASHYDPPSGPIEPECRLAHLLAVADNLDKLAGYLGLGLEPSGSSDPYALRRAASTLIETAWQWPGAFPSYEALATRAFDAYAKQSVKLDADQALDSMAELFSSRYEALLSDVRHDVLEAALLKDFGRYSLDARSVRTRIECVQRLSDDVDFIHTATRPLNIVAAAEKKSIAFDAKEPLNTLEPKSLESEAGEALLRALKERQGPLSDAFANGQADEVIRILLGLSQPINAFFDSTMVMAEDERVRYARLSLLEVARRQILTAGDFSKVVIEG